MLFHLRQELGSNYLPKKEKGLDYWVSKIRSIGYYIQIQDNHSCKTTLNHIFV